MRNSASMLFARFSIIRFHAICEVFAHAEIRFHAICEVFAFSQSRQHLKRLSFPLRSSLWRYGASRRFLQSRQNLKSLSSSKFPIVLWGIEGLFAEQTTSQTPFLSSSKLPTALWGI